MTREQLRVVVIEDHGVVRDGLRVILEEAEDIVLVGVAADGGSGIRLVEDSLRDGVDVVITDIGLPDIDGIEVTCRLKALMPAPRVLALTMYVDDAHVRGLLDAGVDGYLLKQAAADELTEAIHAVARGELVLSPTVARRLATQGQRRFQQQQVATLLTFREREILSLLAVGATSKVVGRRLGMSPKTVENTRGRILTKLGVANTPAAISLAVQQHLLIEERMLSDGRE
jgi:DNA-binding NarL/FixJ family response regulator